MDTSSSSDTFSRNNSQIWAKIVSFEPVVLEQYFMHQMQAYGPLVNIVTTKNGQVVKNGQKWS